MQKEEAAMADEAAGYPDTPHILPGDNSGPEDSTFDAVPVYTW